MEYGFSIVRVLEFEAMVSRLPMGRDIRHLTRKQAQQTQHARHRHGYRRSSGWNEMFKACYLDRLANVHAALSPSPD